MTAGLEPAHGPVVALRDPAANGAVFRWKVAASFASVAAVAALGWNLMANPASEQGAQMASVQGVSAPVLVATENGDVLRDPRLDALLDSHQQYLSRASFKHRQILRNASFQARGGDGAHRVAIDRLAMLAVKEVSYQRLHLHAIMVKTI